MQRRILARGFLPARAWQNGRGKEAFTQRSRRPPERTDLLLQYGLLRRFARQFEGRANTPRDQFQNGRIVPRNCKARSRPKIHSGAALTQGAAVSSPPNLKRGGLEIAP